EKYGYLNADDALKISKEQLVLDYRSYDPNQGLAPYFRAEIKRQLDTILQLKKFRKPNGEIYNIFHDGLKIYTTLDNTLQKYAETAMTKHMTGLQKQYEKAYGTNAPWLKNKQAYKEAKKRLTVYKKLKATGLTEKEIETELKKKRDIELFSWSKTEIKQLSTLDSLEHY